MMAQAYATRPSELLGLDDPYVAFCLDEALYVRVATERPDGDGNAGDAADVPDGAWALNPPRPEEVAQLPVLQLHPGEGE
jgi:hypothetical protein